MCLLRQSSARVDIEDELKQPFIDFSKRMNNFLIDGIQERGGIRVSK